RRTTSGQPCTLCHTAYAPGSGPLFFLEVAACLLADEVEFLALPLESRRRRGLREADVSDGVLDHLVFKVDFILAHREVGTHKIYDPVVNPPADLLLIDGVQGEFHLVMRFVANER